MNEPDTAADSRTMAELMRRLDDQRAHITGALEGLDEADLARPVLPSGWSCAGLVRHLTYDVEWFWFRTVLGGGALAELETALDADSGWQVPAGVSSSQVFAEYAEQIAYARVLTPTLRLDDPPATWPEGLFGNWRLPDVRAVLCHVIVEIACHAGHLDCARELIDGRQWIVL